MELKSNNYIYCKNGIIAIGNILLSYNKLFKKVVLTSLSSNQIVSDLRDLEDFKL